MLLLLGYASYGFYYLVDEDPDTGQYLYSVVDWNGTQFWIKGMGVNYYRAKYDYPDDFLPRVLEAIKRAGFNTVFWWVDDPEQAAEAVKLAATYGLYSALPVFNPRPYARYADGKEASGGAYSGLPYFAMPDFYNPLWRSRFYNKMLALKSMLGDYAKWVAVLFLSNEVEVTYNYAYSHGHTPEDGPSAPNNGEDWYGFIYPLNTPYMVKRLRRVLQEYYSDISSLNSAWGSNFSDWDDFEKRAVSFLDEKWRYRQWRARYEYDIKARFVTRVMLPEWVEVMKYIIQDKLNWKSPLLSMRQQWHNFKPIWRYPAGREPVGNTGWAPADPVVIRAKVADIGLLDSNSNGDIEEIIEAEPLLLWDPISNTTTENSAALYSFTGLDIIGKNYYLGYTSPDKDWIYCPWFYDDMATVFNYVDGANGANADVGRPVMATEWGVQIAFSTSQMSYIWGDEITMAESALHGVSVYMKTPFLVGNIWTDYFDALDSNPVGFIGSGMFWDPVGKLRVIYYAFRDFYSVANRPSSGDYSPFDSANPDGYQLTYDYGSTWGNSGYNPFDASATRPSGHLSKEGGTESFRVVASQTVEVERDGSPYRFPGFYWSDAIPYDFDLTPVSSGGNLTLEAEDTSFFVYGGSKGADGVYLSPEASDSIIAYFKIPDGYYVAYVYARVVGDYAAFSGGVALDIDGVETYRAGLLPGGSLQVYPIPFYVRKRGVQDVYALSFRAYSCARDDQSHDVEIFVDRIVFKRFPSGLTASGGYSGQSVSVNVMESDFYAVPGEENTIVRLELNFSQDDNITKIVAVDRSPVPDLIEDIAIYMDGEKISSSPVFMGSVPVSAGKHILELKYLVKNTGDEYISGAYFKAGLMVKTQKYGFLGRRYSASDLLSSFVSYNGATFSASLSSDYLYGEGVSLNSINFASRDQFLMASLNTSIEEDDVGIFFGYKTTAPFEGKVSAGFYDESEGVYFYHEFAGAHRYGWTTSSSYGWLEFFAPLWSFEARGAGLTPERFERVSNVLLLVSPVFTSSNGDFPFVSVSGGSIVLSDLTMVRAFGLKNRVPLVSGLQVLVDDVSTERFDFAFGGKYILYTRDDSLYAKLIDADGDGYPDDSVSEREEIFLTRGAYFVSAYGEYISYVKNDGDSELYLARLEETDGGASLKLVWEKKITNDIFSQYSPKVTREWVYFWSDMEGKGRIYRVRYDDGSVGTPERVYPVPSGGNYDPDVFDGCIVNLNDDGLVVYEEGAGDYLLIPEGVNERVQPSWLPDGRGIIYSYGGKVAVAVLERTSTGFRVKKQDIFLYPGLEVSQRWPRVTVSKRGYIVYFVLGSTPARIVYTQFGASFGALVVSRQRKDVYMVLPPENANLSSSVKLDYLGDGVIEISPHNVVFEEGALLYFPEEMGGYLQYWDGVKWIDLSGRQIYSGGRYRVIENRAEVSASSGASVVTPNSDGVNDMVYFNLPSEAMVEIFTLSGTRVFRSDKPYWKPSPSLPPGVYLWVISLSDGTVIKRGTVVLIK